MYSDEDLDAAVEAGALPPEMAARFRAFVAARRRTALPDEEAFRLLSGFNDIFVALALALTLGAFAYLTEALASGAGPLLIGAAAWGLAEFFTRRRRMALPSFLLALVFLAASGLVGGQLFAAAWPDAWLEDRAVLAAVAAGLAIAALAGWAHWRRFRVPVTMAALVLAALAAPLVFAVVLFPGLRDWLNPMLFATGLAAFAAALRWDASDPERLTRRSDVALWLHLAAAPLIVHPLFTGLGLLGDELRALAVLAIYLGFMLVALVIDRRALLVAALSYVIYAVGALLAERGSVAAVLPVAALAIGLLLLTLSAWWRALRRPLVARLPAGWRRRLPGV